MTDQTADASEFARRVLDTLALRTSCREFDGSEIDRETLTEIVRDGMEAPSSKNQQNWHFIVITDREMLKTCEKIAGGNPHFADCSALIYLCFQKGWTHGNFSIVQSVAGACYHMIVSAQLRGFATIWNAGIGSHEKLHPLLGLPRTFELQGALAIGRARVRDPLPKAPRRPVEEVLSFGSFERPAHTIYPARPAERYPYFEITNETNPFAVWDPTAWTWDQLADTRGYSVWSKSPTAGVYQSRRHGASQEAEHSLLPDGARTVAEIMPWSGTSTVRLLSRLHPDARLHVDDLSPHNLLFMKERLASEGLDPAAVDFHLMPGGHLPHGDASMDLVVMPMVLEHAAEPLLLLDEVARVLRPGGHLVLSARNRDSAYGRYWEDVESRGQIPSQGPFTPFAASDVRSMVAARFTIEHETGIGRSEGGDAEMLSGEELMAGRLYAARARKA
ncbi:nitroreductase family protein (plasmid) [Sulfitobacter sp. LCG007]